VGVLAYGIGFGEFWKQYLKAQIANWPEAIESSVFYVGLLVPMLILAAASIDYDNESQERPKDAVEERGYLSLWRGEGSLVRAFWGFCLISTFLVTTAAQRLIHVIAQAASPMQILWWAIVFTLFLGFHIVAAVGTWRSATRFAGPKKWALFAKLGVVISFVAFLLALFLGSVGINMWNS